METVKLKDTEMSKQSFVKRPVSAENQREIIKQQNFKGGNN